MNNVATDVLPLTAAGGFFCFDFYPEVRRAPNIFSTLTGRRARQVRDSRSSRRLPVRSRDLRHSALNFTQLNVTGTKLFNMSIMGKLYYVHQKYMFFYGIQDNLKLIALSLHLSANVICIM